MNQKRRLLITGVFVVLLMCASGTLISQSVGIRAGRYMDSEEYFLGGELLSRVAGNLYFNPNGEYVFVDNLTYITFNLDFHYDFYTTSPLFFWMGAGLGILYSNPEGPPDSDTDLGVNLIFGVAINTISSLTPYFQGKYILADKNEFVLAVGLRF